VPGTRLRFGLDALIGLLPGGGDLITAVMGSVILVHAHRSGVPKVVQLRMLMNIGIDIAAGLVPVAGDVADVFWKSNTRNLALLERHAGRARPAGSGDWLFVVGVLTALVLMATIPMVLLLWALVVLGERGFF
jgi:hypothetical protein